MIKSKFWAIVMICILLLGCGKEVTINDEFQVLMNGNEWSGWPVKKCVFNRSGVNDTYFISLQFYSDSGNWKESLTFGNLLLSREKINLSAIDFGKLGRDSIPSATFSLGDYDVSYKWYQMIDNKESWIRIEEYTDEYIKGSFQVSLHTIWTGWVEYDRPDTLHFTEGTFVAVPRM